VKTKSAYFLPWGKVNSHGGNVKSKATLVLLTILSTSLLLGVLPAMATTEVSISDCEKEIIANKSFLIFKGKLDLLNTANQPTEILANNKVPSKQEKAAISLWVEEQKRCSAPGIEYHKSQSPEVGAIFDKAYAELFIAAADLYQGKITYGDFGRSTVRRHQEVRERIAAVVARFREQQANKAQQENIAKQQAAQQENIARQQAEQQAIARRQERCESLRQQINSAINSSPTPYQVQQQRQAQDAAYADKFAQMNAAQRGAYGMSQAGAGLGRMLGGAMGMVDPQMEQAQQRQAVLMQQVEIYKRNCQNR
jgi:hypothetical protein